MKKAVFLDRDGVVSRAVVINNRPFSIRRASDLQILDEVNEALGIFGKLALIPIIISNQPDVARGLLSQLEHEKIESKIVTLTGISKIYTCTHDEKDNCFCRKPKPGLILKAAEDHDIDITKSYLIGDRWRDMDLAKNVDCRSFFINRNYEEKYPEYFDYETGSILESAKIIEKLEKG